MSVPANKLPAIYSGVTGANHPPGVVERAERNLIGRASKIDEETTTVILRELISGNTIEKTCEIAGISKATFYVWKRVNPDFSDAIDRARNEWTAALVNSGLDQLVSVQANDKDDGVKVRKAECIARHTLEIASRLNPAYAAKQQQTNLNLNVNVDLDPVDMGKYK